MIRLFCFRELLVLLIFSVSSEGIDPCLEHDTINDPYRSTGYVAVEGVDPMICDRDITPGWYRFVNKVGGMMPETKVYGPHCGTVAPIWMQGSHPSTEEGIVDRTACVNYNDLMDGCLPISIKVKNCSGAFYVYYLLPPHGCQMAYCAGML